MLSTVSSIPFVDRSRRETAREKRLFATARRAEREYSRQMRILAKHIGDLVKEMLPEAGATIEDIEAARFRIDHVLRTYAVSLRPWAEAIAKRMLADVMRRDETAWANSSKEMAKSLGKEIRTAPTGAWLKRSLAENVELITSLPIDAAKRVHERVLKAQETGERADVLARDLKNTGQVTKSRAMLIARTETARAASGLTEARARHVGATHYVWRSAEDMDVRKRHKKLNGRVFSWDDPPVAGENGERAHAGAIYNCRCYPEPIIPDEIE